MEELDPRIRVLFGNDERPELSWTYSTLRVGRELSDGLHVRAVVNEVDDGVELLGNDDGLYREFGA